MAKHPSRQRKATPCGHPDCEGLVWSRGYCAAHYTSLKKSGVLAPVKPRCSPEERFERSYVADPETGCWNWTGPRHGDGYALLTLPGRKNCRASRYSYERFVGPIAPGLFALHQCDNIRCVNPEHIFLGTGTDNMRDCVAKGRHGAVKGTSRSKLTPKMAECIRVLYARGTHSIQILSEIYNVRFMTIANVVKGRGHLGPT